MKDEPRPIIALGCEYPLSVRGGVTILVEELIAGLSQEFRVVLISPDRKIDIEEREGVHEHIFWEPRAVSRATSRSLAKQLANSNVRLAHLHFGGVFGWGVRVPGQSPFPFLARTGIASVSTSHLVVSILNGYCDEKKSFAFKLALLPVAWLGKLSALRHVQTEIVVSIAGCKKLQRWYRPLQNRFRHVYHSRIHPESLSSSAVPREQMIVCVGHIAFRKGQHILADAFAQAAHQLPGWKLVLVGHNAEEACWRQIEEIATRSHLRGRIQLIGRHEDVSDFFKRAAIYVQPSLFEGLPLSLQEAMFQGCACIATAVDGNLELIDNESNGLLVPVNQPAAMAAGLVRLASDTSLRDKFSVRARESILRKEMTAPRMVGHYIELYKTILASPKRSIFR